jgi:L-Ala-D/L-Glu epimerase
MPKLLIAEERWPIAGSFTISRGAKTEAHVVTVTLTDGATCGPRRMRAISPL